MAEIINLNRARKSRAKAEAKAQAAENRAAHGRPKEERDHTRAEAERQARCLDGARREYGDPPPAGGDGLD